MRTVKMSEKTLAKILEKQFAKKGDDAKNPRDSQDVEKVNNTGNNTEITTNTLTKDKLNVSNTAPVTTPKSKGNKLKFKTIAEGVIHRLQQRNQIFNISGSEDQRLLIRKQLTEAHGMMGRFAREYEENKLKFIPPTNVRQDDDSTEDDEENRFADFQSRVDNVAQGADPSSQLQKTPEDEGQNGEQDMDMSFGATGSDGYTDVSGDVTLGDIINKVIEAIRENPDMSVTDAVKASISATDKTMDDFDFDDEDQPEGDDYETGSQRPSSTPTQTSQTQTSQTQDGQNADGTLMKFRRM